MARKIRTSTITAALATLLLTVLAGTPAQADSCSKPAGHGVHAFKRTSKGVVYYRNGKEAVRYWFACSYAIGRTVRLSTKEGQYATDTPRRFPSTETQFRITRSFVRVHESSEDEACETGSATYVREFSLITGRWMRLVFFENCDSGDSGPVGDRRFANHP